jgi:tetratricopeptide (TPR) repeat protein
MLLGRYSEAESALRDVLVAAQRLGLDSIALNVKHNLGLVLAHLGRFDEAVQLEEESLAGYIALGDSKLTGSSQHYLAVIFWKRGELGRAESHARSAVEAFTAFPPLLPRAVATLAAIQLAQARVSEAAQNADRAKLLLDAQGEIEDGEATIRLVHAETLLARGHNDEARSALATARDRIRRVAEKISDPELCQSFLERVPENARTLALAASWTTA